MTHEHLAAQLERLLQEAAQVKKSLGKGPDAPVWVDFLYTPHRDETIVAETQRILVSHRSFMGAQWSFFRNLNVNDNPSPEDTLSWKEDHEVSNEKLPNCLLHIAGGVGTGICHYIGKYGFYEGGFENPYRISPVVLHSVLSGATSPLTGHAALDTLQHR